MTGIRRARSASASRSALYASGDGSSPLAPRSKERALSSPTRFGSTPKSAEGARDERRSTRRRRRPTREPSAGAARDQPVREHPNAGADASVVGVDERPVAERRVAPATQVEVAVQHAVRVDGAARVDLRAQRSRRAEAGEERGQRVELLDGRRRTRDGSGLVKEHLAARQIHDVGARSRPEWFHRARERRSQERHRRRRKRAQTGRARAGAAGRP